MSDGIRVIVCGGRDYRNSYAFYEAMDALHAATPIYAVLHGNAAGADTLADQWAKSRKVRCWPHPAFWSKYGNAAGPIRNKQMLGQGVDLVVAFPGGKGTRNMVKQAKAAGVKVIEPVASGGRPMIWQGYAFRDVVSGKAVHHWVDHYGRHWLAEHKWARFRVERAERDLTKMEAGK